MRKNGLAVLLAMGLLLAAVGCRTVEEPSRPKRPEVSGLQLGPVVARATGGYEVAGSVKAARVTALAPQTIGRVVEVPVREGAVVRQGQLLVVLAAPDAVQRTSGAGQQVEAARAARELADATYVRTEALFQQAAVARQELDRAYAAKQAAAAEEARARAGLAEAAAVEGYLGLRAPYDGVVTRQLAEVGMVASPAQPLVTVENQAEYEIESWVDVAYAGRIQPGMQVALLRADAGKPSQPGMVTQVSPGAIPDARSFLVKVMPGTGGWSSGEFVRVRFPLAAEQRLTVPRQAVQDRGQLTGVYVVGPDRVVSYRLIRLGRTEGEQVEVLAGLTGQEEIVIAGVERAIDGALLKEAP